MIRQGDRPQANYRRSETLPIFTGDYYMLNQGNVLIREHIKENTFKLFQGPYRINYDVEKRIEGQGYSKTYNANSVSIYSKA